jgi:hypothetical protein
MNRIELNAKEEKKMCDCIKTEFRSSVDVKKKERSEMGNTRKRRS